MSINTQGYGWIKVNGPISIVPITPKEVKNRYIYAFVLLGPTGSGKSSFIESLSPDQHLDISKDSLESVTQEVNCYQVVNLGVQPGWADRLFVLMDTPGFLDPRLSEGRITRMVTERLDLFRTYAEIIMVLIVYFQPITDIRIGGSKRHAVNVLREYVTGYNAQEITVITTMWNTISTPRQLKDADRRFESLKSEIYASSDGLEIKVSKFDIGSSKDSILPLLDTSAFGWTHRILSSNKFTGSSYRALLRDNLLIRVTNFLLQLQLIAEDKQSATSTGSENWRLLEIVLRDETVALTTLQSFLDDLACEDIGPSGMMALQSLLDARYEEDPNACLSPWLPQVALVWHRLHSTHVPTPTTIQSRRTPSPVTLFFASIVASFQRRFNWTQE